MKSDDYPEFRAMKVRGDSPEIVFLAADRQHDTITSIRILRAVFGFSLAHAKEVMIRARGEAKSLDEYQDKLLPALKQALEQDDTDT